MGKLIKVEVVYASKERQELVECEVAAGSTLREAIQASGILVLFPELVLDQLSIGIFSARRRLGDIVNTGNRIEIYRPLEMDPKEARRLRALKDKEADKS
jgi:putative ubiquitin-RnfH superfamily antitoxin RatB of RatAB toxin-antitoxin module